MIPFIPQQRPAATDPISVSDALALPDWVAAIDSQHFERELSKRLPLFRPFAKPKKAAICILLVGDSPATASVVLTHRNPSLRRFSGHISFPGGHVEPEDRTPVDTALREAAEETGLKPESVAVLRQARPVSVRTARYPIYPVLCWWQSPHELWRQNLPEVDETFSITLKELCKPENVLRTTYGNWVGPAFWHDGYLIWGFTAGVLATMVDCAGWKIPWSEINSYDINTVLDRSRNDGRLRDLDR